MKIALNGVYVIYLLAGAVALGPLAHANDWPEAKHFCHGDQCVSIPTAAAGLAAFNDIRAQLVSKGEATLNSTNAETWAAIGVGTVATAGTAYGVGKYRAYKAGIEQASRQASLLRAETRRAVLAIKQTLAPELQRFGSALVELQKKRGRALVRSEIEQALRSGLTSSDSKARIMTALRERLGPAAEATFEKILSEKNLLSFSRVLESVLTRSGANQVAGLAMRKELEQVGVTMAGDVAARLAPSTAQLTLKHALYVAAQAAQKGLFSRCAARIARIFGPLMGVVGSGWFAGALILAESSELADGTSDGYFARNPQALFDLPPADAERWVKNYSNVRMALVKLRDFMKVSGDLSAIASERPVEDFDVSGCFLDANESYQDLDFRGCGGRAPG